MPTRLMQYIHNDKLDTGRLNTGKSQPRSIGYLRTIQ